MLGRGHQWARGISQDSRKFSGGNGGELSANLTLATTVKAGAQEANPAAGIGRM
jgi:hypothetical protein